MLRIGQLDGDELDYWVAAALRINDPTATFGDDPAHPHVEDVADNDEDTIMRRMRPSLSWRDAGPLIERFHIKIDPDFEFGCEGKPWVASLPDTRTRFAAKSPLVAAMRALVHSVYGETVPDDPRPRATAGAAK